MRMAPRPRRQGRLSCLVLAGLVLWASCVQAASPFGARERLSQPLGPLAEKALVEVVDKAEPLQRELLTRHMKVLLDDMQVVFALTAKERAGLELDAASMVTVATRQWKDCARDSVRPMVPRDSGGDADMAEWIVERQRPAELVPYQPVPHWTPPEQLPHWTRALEKRLGLQRATQWEQMREEQRRKLLPAMQGFLQRWAAICRERLDLMQKERLQLLRADAAFSHAQAEALTERLRQLLDSHVAAEIDIMHGMLMTVPDQSLENVMSPVSQADCFAMPSETEMEAAWQDVVAAETGPAGLQQWHDMVNRKTKKRDLRIAQMLEPGLRLERLRMESIIDSKVDGVVAMLDLDDERSRKVAALGGRVVAETLETARLDWTQRLIVMEKAGTPLDESPEIYELGIEHGTFGEKAWLAGLQALLSAAELQQAQQDEAEFFHTEVLRALGRCAVVEVDKLLALDARQRVEMEKIFAVELKEVPAGAWELRAADVVAVMTQVPKEVLGRILDATQMAELATVVANTEAVPKQPPPATAAAAEEPTMVAANRHAQVVKVRRSLLRLMLVQVADARRVLRLPPEKVALLTTAAKGAVEAALAPLRERFADMMWAGEESPAEMNEMRLRSALRGTSPEQAAVWQDALEETLSSAQRQTWQHIMEERAAYRLTAITDMSVAELARRYRLKNSQREKIRNLMRAALSKHGQDIDRLTFTGHQAAWYLESTFCLLPVATVPKEQLRAALTPRQWNQLHEQDMPLVQSLWRRVLDVDKEPEPVEPPPWPAILLR